MTDLERFLACMEYQSADRRPNHELGVWPQTKARWEQEAPDAVRGFAWDWFAGEDALGLDRRLFIPVDFGFIPPFEHKVLERTDRYEVVQDARGIVHKALLEGTVGGGRMCMDQYLSFPLSKPEDWPAVRRRLEAALPQRYPPDLDAQVAAWQRRTCPLILGRNCAANGFYWRAREFLGTEALSFAWYDHPALMHEIMEFFADFIIETARPVLQKVRIEYFCLNEDMAMKGGPLLSPATFREFIFPHLRRMVDFFRSHGTRYFAVDTDGDPTPLLPLLMDAGVDTLWPIERAAGTGPQELRRKFGRGLRLWGGVDKRVLPLGPAAIRAHLRELLPLIEEGGFIPTVDHTVPPDVSWDDFRYYRDAKRALLAGEFARLDGGSASLDNPPGVS
jgi:uroporphyrinogen decarboxylase